MRGSYELELHKSEVNAWSAKGTRWTNASTSFDICGDIKDSCSFHRSRQQWGGQNAIAYQPVVYGELFKALGSRVSTPAVASSRPPDRTLGPVALSARA